MYSSSDHTLGASIRAVQQNLGDARWRRQAKDALRTSEQGAFELGVTGDTRGARLDANYPNGPGEVAINRVNRE